MAEPIWRLACHPGAFSFCKGCPAENAPDGGPSYCSKCLDVRFVCSIGKETTLRECEGCYEYLRGECYPMDEFKAATKVR